MEMEKPLEEMTEAELADWQYAHRAELDADEGEPVDDLEIAPDVSLTMSFRLSGVEADAIRTAAADSGSNLSEWIRAACAGAVEDQRRLVVDPALDQLGNVLRILERNTHDAQGIIARLRSSVHEQEEERSKETVNC